MHIYTLVITPGPRRSAVARAEALLSKATPNYVDYWSTGGWFSDRLGKVERPEIEAWHAARDLRRERFEAKNPADRSTEAASDFEEVLWNMDETPHVQRLRKLEAEARIDLTRLTIDLPRPLPEGMVPAALVRPDGRWRIRPVTWEQGDPRWSRWVDATIDSYRGGHCVVPADCHC